MNKCKCLVELWHRAGSNLRYFPSFIMSIPLHLAICRLLGIVSLSFALARFQSTSQIRSICDFQNSNSHCRIKIRSLRFINSLANHIKYAYHSECQNYFLVLFLPFLDNVLPMSELTECERLLFWWMNDELRNKWCLS